MPAGSGQGGVPPVVAWSGMGACLADWQRGGWQVMRNPKQLVALIGSAKSADAASFAISYMRNKCLGIPALITFFSVIGAFRGYKVPPESGIYKTVTARFWPWLSGERL